MIDFLVFEVDLCLVQYCAPFSGMG